MRKEMRIVDGSAERVDEILFLVFRPRLALALAAVQYNDTYDHGDKWWLDSQRYSQAFDSFVAFYDWLRTINKQIVGIRFWLEDDTQVVAKDLSQFPYVLAVNEGKALEVYFSPDHQIDVENSGDQDFIPNKVFLNDKGEWAIALYITGVINVGMGDLQARGVDWISAHGAGMEGIDNGLIELNNEEGTKKV